MEERLNNQKRKRRAVKELNKSAERTPLGGKSGHARIPRNCLNNARE